MILSFDSIAQELEVDLENGLPPFTVSLKRLVVKYYLWA